MHILQLTQTVLRLRLLGQLPSENLPQWRQLRRLPGRLPQLHKCHELLSLRDK